VADLFDMDLRAKRRDRAARLSPELFLHERAFGDCLDRITLSDRRFENALLIGCPDAKWAERLTTVAQSVDVRDPGYVFSEAAGGEIVVEDRWVPLPQAYDLVLAVGTLDTVNELPFALHLVRQAMRGDGLIIGAMSGNQTVPQLRAAMRAADALEGVAAAHVHPRIEASAFAPLLEQAGFRNPVIDVDRVRVTYRTFDQLIADLRAMAATNILKARPRFLSRAARHAAAESFVAAGEGERTVETFEIIHFAAWAKP
jgi:hypothetical protein